MKCSNTPETQSEDVSGSARRRFCRGLDKLGWTYEKPRASMFVWAKINQNISRPEKEPSISACR